MKDKFALRGLSTKMSPLNPKRGAGNYKQSSGVGYYRLLDSLVSERSERTEVMFGFWNFANVHAAFLSHIEVRLAQQQQRIEPPQEHSA